MSAPSRVLAARPAMDETVDYVTVGVAGQSFGLPIRRIRDLFKVGPITPVPLAPPEIVGLINVRGRVATALCLRRRLGLGEGERDATIAVGVEARGDLFALLVEQVGEVVRLSSATREDKPVHLCEAWSGLSICVHRLDATLLVILDVEAVLDLDATA